MQVYSIKKVLPVCHFAAKLGDLLHNQVQHEHQVCSNQRIFEANIQVGVNVRLHKQECPHRDHGEKIR